MTPEVQNHELAKEIEAGVPLVLLDVREAHELEHGTLPNILHVPMIDVPDHLDELDKDAPIVVICRSGSRSTKITDFLVRQGFTNVRNLAGGMNAWAQDIDPTMKVY